MIFIFAPTGTIMLITLTTILGFQLLLHWRQKSVYRLIIQPEE